RSAARHCTNDRLEELKRSLELQLHHLSEVIFIDVEEWLTHPEASAIDRDVDTAQLSHSFGGKFINALLTGDVGDRPATVHILRECFQGVGVPARDKHFGTFLHEATG